MMHDEARFVAGESLEAVARALIKLKLGREPDGTASFSGSFQPEEGAPLFAALMRIEAELLADDADEVSSGRWNPRTTTQRRADALVELARRVGEAYSD